VPQQKGEKLLARAANSLHGTVRNFVRG